MAVRLFVGNLSYTTTEADLRTYFGTVAPPSQVVLPVDRETGRPRGFAFVEYLDRAARRAGDSALQRPGVQRTAARGQRGARARGSRARAVPRGPAASRARGRAGGGFAPRPPGSFGGPPRPFDPSAPGAAAEPQLRARRQAAARRQRQGQEEGDRASARTDPAQGHRPLVHARRRLAGRGAAGHRRFRHEQADDEDEDRQGRTSLATSRIPGSGSSTRSARGSIDEESFRRWFSSTVVRQRLRRSDHRLGALRAARAATSSPTTRTSSTTSLATLDRADTHVRFVVTGMDEDDEGKPDD